VKHVGPGSLLIILPLEMPKILLMYEYSEVYNQTNGPQTYVFVFGQNF